MIKAERIHTLDLPDDATIENTHINIVGNCLEVAVISLYTSKYDHHGRSFYDYGFLKEINSNKKIVICFDHNVTIKEFKFIKAMNPYIRIVLEVELEENK